MSPAIPAGSGTGGQAPVYRPRVCDGRLNPEENENPDDYAFIFASVEDNRHLLKSSPAYLQMLSDCRKTCAAPSDTATERRSAARNSPEFFGGPHVVRPFAIPDDWAR
jgi:hypothetical protein